MNRKITALGACFLSTLALGMDPAAAVKAPAAATKEIVVICQSSGMSFTKKMILYTIGGTAAVLYIDKKVFHGHIICNTLADLLSDYGRRYEELKTQLQEQSTTLGAIQTEQQEHGKQLGAIDTRTQKQGQTLERLEAGQTEVRQKQEQLVAGVDRLESGQSSLAQKFEAGQAELKTGQETLKTQFTQFGEGQQKILAAVDGKGETAMAAWLTQIKAKTGKVEVLKGTPATH